MAFNPSPQVADAREIARKWNVQQVVILGLDLKHGAIQLATYGENKQLCGIAKDMGEQILKLISTGEITPKV